MKQEELYQEISQLLTTLFDIKPDQITPESRLYEDLDLDSIDAVDMIVYLQKKTEKKITPEAFKTVRTVQDVINVLAQLLDEGSVSTH